MVNRIEVKFIAVAITLIFLIIAMIKWLDNTPSTVEVAGKYQASYADVKETLSLSLDGTYQQILQRGNRTFNNTGKWEVSKNTGNIVLHDFINTISSSEGCVISPGQTVYSEGIWSRLTRVISLDEDCGQVYKFVPE